MPNFLTPRPSGFGISTRRVRFSPPFGASLLLLCGPEAFRDQTGISSDHPAGRRTFERRSDEGRLSPRGTTSAGPHGPGSREDGSGRLQVAAPHRSVKLHRDAEELARIAQTIPSDVASIHRGTLPKGTIPKLKEIEKLSKRAAERTQSLEQGSALASAGCYRHRSGKRNPAGFRGRIFLSGEAVRRRTFGRVRERERGEPQRSWIGWPLPRGTRFGYFPRRCVAASKLISVEGRPSGAGAKNEPRGILQGLGVPTSGCDWVRR
jgi:hypothetical protein